MTAVVGDAAPGMGTIIVEIKLQLDFDGSKF